MAALTLIVAFLYFLRIKFSNSPPAIPSDAFIQVVDVQESIQSSYLEQLQLFDSEPLFIPTKWNASSHYQEISRTDDPARIFGNFPPEISLGIDEIYNDGLSAALEKSSATHQLLQPDVYNLWPDWGYGQLPQTSRVLARGSYSILDLSTGQQVRHGPLPPDLPDGFINGPWQPVRFLIQVDYGGLVGTPFRQQGSGVEGLDEALLQTVEQFEFLRDLNNGYYQVRFAP